MIFLLSFSYSSLSFLSSLTFTHPDCVSITLIFTHEHTCSFSHLFDIDDITPQKPFFKFTLALAEPHFLSHYPFSSPFSPSLTPSLFLSITHSLSLSLSFSPSLSFSSPLLIPSFSPSIPLSLSHPPSLLLPLL